MYNEIQILKDKKDKMKINDIMIKHNIKSAKTIYDILQRNGREHIVANKKYSINDKYFEKIDNEEKSYWLGFLYADGYVRFVKNRSGELKLKLQIKDKHHIELFKKNISSNHPIKDLISKVKIDDKIYISKCSNLSIYNTKIVKDLVNLGCVNKKSLIIKFPILNENLIRHFIRGYFDGDGCVTTKNRYSVNIISGSYDFLYEITRILNEIDFNLEIKPKGKIHKIEFNNKNKFIKFYHYLYDDSTICLYRKKQKFENKINI